MRFNNSILTEIHSQKDNLMKRIYILALALLLLASPIAG